MATFIKVMAAIHPQVDHTFVYLDGYPEVPGFLREYGKVSIRRAEAIGDLHASARFLCLRELTRPATIFSVDDDIAYPRDYVSVLGRTLEQLQGGALIGVHGRVFLPPHRSNVIDASCIHFSSELKQPRHVHELGSGTLAFLSTKLDIDPRNWTRTDMDDILIAIEAQQRRLPRILVPRPQGWPRPLAENQEDSLWVRTQKDDAAQSEAMRRLLRLYADQPQLSQTPPRQSHEGPRSPMRG